MLTQFLALRTAALVAVATALPAAATPGPQPTTPPQLDRFTVQPGPVALLIVVLLGVAFFFLGRSMNRQIRRIHFDDTGRTDAERARGRRTPPTA